MNPREQRDAILRRKAALDKSRQSAPATQSASKRNTHGRAAQGEDVPDRRPKPAPPPSGKVLSYFDCFSGSYYAMNTNGEYQRYPDRAFSLLLREAGFFKGHDHENGLSYLEQEILRITREQTVHFAGPLGGFDPGVYEINGSRVLVTHGPKFIKPVQGDFSTLADFLKVLFGPQLKYFLAWVKVAQDALRRGVPWAPGQMLAIAGAPGAGKSLLQSLITPMLGGRASTPYEYLTGGTKFNAEIFGAEHALIGDQNHAVDNRSRRNFASAIKNLVCNKEQYVHKKGTTPITLTPFLRLTISLNDNPSALLVLPSFDSDVKDKILLLRALKGKWAWPSKRFPDSQTFYAQLLKELPGFLYSLRRWKIPESIADERYGVTSFHDPSLIREVDDLSEEQKLIDVIDTYIFGDHLTDFWTGTATDLEKRLSEVMRPGETARLFRYSSHCGGLLSALAQKMPDRIQVEKRGANKSYYTIVKG